LKGKPVDLAKRYYEEGADEIVFLNITSFRQCPLKDTPMLRVLEATSKSVFVPLTIGGGIRNIIEPDGSEISALTVAGEYFRSGADKVSIGSDAVFAAEKFYKSGGKGDGTSAIEQISKVYGAQAVVISVDPRRVYVQDPSETPHHVIRTNFTGPKGERFCWYQCTVKGGRECRDLDIFQLVHACISLGAGEFLVNSMDKDGTNSGFDLELLNDVKSISTVPVIASSGAGKPEHFSELFNVTNAEAGLAAGIFHRKEVPISAVKAHLEESGYKIRC
jgi:glutamine amidotransferase/cyclase